ncbi:MAG: transglycosylase domain-containing protein, partial [Clostridia bacterium]|nr:transglycosylase domain-containing protein [Clostridia bacterium]
MLNERKKGGFLRFLLSCTLGLLVLSAIGIAGIGIWAGALDTALDEEVFLSAAGDKTTRLYAYDRNGELLELSGDRVSGYENALYCPLEQMSPYLRDAFVAIEDKRFYTHGGIDWIRTLAAAKEYVVGGRSDFGGSTITQQLIKNLTGESEKSVRRKVAELIRAAKLEKRLSKNQILEQYLNVVNLSQNCYGVRTAANAYFSKEVQELTLVEAASIAAITNNPTKYDPIRHPERNRERRDVILGEMYRQGMIDRESYLEAIEQQTELYVDP